MEKLQKERQQFDNYTSQYIPTWSLFCYYDNAYDHDHKLYQEIKDIYDKVWERYMDSVHPQERKILGNILNDAKKNYDKSRELFIDLNSKMTKHEKTLIKTFRDLAQTINVLNKLEKDLGLELTEKVID